MNARRLSVVVGACAVVVYLGALGNRFALDDLLIIAGNPLVHAIDGVWRAFAAPYWPGGVGGPLYRPLVIASYAFDWRLHSLVWFHAVNLVWHAAASVMVAVLARRWAGDAAGLLAGILFAVHPVHVEAVANIVGRAELMAALFVMLAVYGALATDRLGWSTFAWLCGLLSKETAIVAPGLIITGWIVGLARPARPRVTAYALAWIAAGAAYAWVRWRAVSGYGGFPVLAPVFLGADPVAIRLTAVAAFTDVVRLLLVPLTLRVDYAPNERTLVTSALDWRLGLGLCCLAGWVALLILAWRRGKRVEAFGLAWIGIALLPVANLVFPTGILIAERTLYLPSVGLALAAGGWGRALRGRALGAVAVLLFVAGGLRTVTRVPVWRDDTSVVLSILEDSPRSYRGPMGAGLIYLEHRQAAQALDAFRAALRAYPGETRLYLLGARAAYLLGRPDVADSLETAFDGRCQGPCEVFYRAEAVAARQAGETAAADSLLAHVGRETSR